MTLISQQEPVYSIDVLCEAGTNLCKLIASLTERDEGLDMQQWEYLVVTVKGMDSDRAVYAVNGEKLQNFPLPKIHLLINRLGEEGWEMTGSTDCDSYSVSDLFFKRPKP
jgi:hypothetical protein